MEGSVSLLYYLWWYLQQNFDFIGARVVSERLGHLMCVSSPAPLLRELIKFIYTHVIKLYQCNSINSTFLAALLGREVFSLDRYHVLRATSMTSPFACTR